MSLQNGVADVFPAILVLKRLSAVYIYLRQTPLRDVRVLVQRHRPAVPHRKIDLLQPVVLRNAAAVRRVFVARGELHHQPDGAVRLRRLPVGADDGEPVVDELPGDDLVGRDFRDADEVGAEYVVAVVTVGGGGGDREMDSSAVANGWRRWRGDGNDGITNQKIPYELGEIAQPTPLVGRREKSSQHQLDEGEAASPERRVATSRHSVARRTVDTMNGGNFVVL
nr:hypothetical protein PanWU01x14_307310 [Ipomoea batatas]